MPVANNIIVGSQGAGKVLLTAMEGDHVHPLCGSLSPSLVAGNIFKFIVCNLTYNSQYSLRAPQHSSPLPHALVWLDMVAVSPQNGIFPSVSIGSGTQDEPFCNQLVVKLGGLMQFTMSEHL